MSEPTAAATPAPPAPVAETVATTPNAEAANNQSKRLSDVLSDGSGPLSPGIVAPSMIPTASQLAALTPEEQVQKLQTLVADLNGQVTGLNNKLVKSFMRISDLEDDLSETRDRATAGSSRVAELEKEREEHLGALNTGLLVEKDHVSVEMQRMMDRVIEETKQRGQAESDKAKIEAELDELSASLFNEANRMVAVEKLARSRAEEKSKHMEERLQDTEGIMLEQQKILGNLQSELEDLRAKEEEGSRENPKGRVQHLKLGQRGPLSRSSSHLARDLRASGFMGEVGSDERFLQLNTVPFQELRAFVAHLRRLRKQLAPFYNYPYDPSRPTAAHKRTTSTDLVASTPPLRTGSPAVGQPASPSPLHPNATIDSASSREYLTNPFLMAGLARHKDYPTLPSNCEQLVHLPSQLSLPFIKRAQEEDADPCLRLDFAPGLNWLTRRTANTAVLDGSLLIEPIFSGGVVPDEDAVRAQHAHLPPAACAMCGMIVVNVPLPGSEDAKTSSESRTVSGWASSMAAATGSAVNSLREVAGDSSSASGSPKADTSTDKPTLKPVRSGLFGSLSSLRNKTGSPRLPTSASAASEGRDGVAGEDGPAPTGSSATSEVSTSLMPGPLPVPTHIFRLSDAATTRYMLCPQHCLTRLRAACAFWGYLRHIERAIVLEGKLAWDDQPHTSGAVPRSAPAKGSVKLSPHPSSAVQDPIARTGTPLLEVSTDTSQDSPTVDISESSADAATPTSTADLPGQDTATELRSSTEGSADEEDGAFHDAADDTTETLAAPSSNQDIMASSSATSPTDAAAPSSATSASGPPVPPRRRPVPALPASAAGSESTPTPGGPSSPSLSVPPPVPPRSAPASTLSASGSTSALPPPPAAVAPLSGPPLQRKYVRMDGSVDDNLTRAFTLGLNLSSSTDDDDEEADEDGQPINPLGGRSGTDMETETESGDASVAPTPSPALTFEEKVYLEILRLKREMFLARAGVKEGDEVREEAKARSLRLRSQRERQASVVDVTVGGEPIK